MNIKWEKIKNNILNEKVLEIESLFLEVEKNTSVEPRNQWINPIKHWTQQQFKLNLEDYCKLKYVIDNMNESFTNSLEAEYSLKHYSEVFRDVYLNILLNKESDLQIEVAAELIEDTKLPLDFLCDWYLMNYDLPSERFDESLGEFWGDIKSGAAHGAGVGALAGGASGSLAGMGGTFAGAGIGGLLGGLTGGIYSGGKHMLKKVWNYRKNQVEFDRTKEEALEALKKLKDQSSKFEMDANFKSLLNSLIDKLGVAKAYKVAQPARKNIEPEIVPEPKAAIPEPVKAPEPMKAPEIPPEIVEPEVKTPLPRRRRNKKPIIHRPLLQPEEQPEEQPKLGQFKNLHDLTRYYHAHPEQVAVLGHILNEMGWADADVDDIEFEQLNSALEGTEHLHVPEKAVAFDQYKNVGDEYLKKLKQRFSMTHPIETRQMEYAL